MTKNNAEIMNKILSKQKELNINEEIMKFITDTLETAGHKSTTIKNPNYIDDKTGIEYKWCIRHEQYEQITEWTMPKSGKLDASCDVAVRQWKEFSKDVKKAESAMMKNTDQDKMIELQTIWITAKNIRSGKYKYPTEEA